MLTSATAVLVTLGFLLAPTGTTQAASKPAPLKSANAAAVPRSAFIQTMDGEFGKMDADKNKSVTKAEIEQFQRAVALAEARARAQATFSNLDADKNGQLSLTEFERLAAPSSQPNATPILGQFDLNRDGSITLVEYRTAKLANFDRMDADKDGIVSVEEMKAAGLVK